MKKIMVLLITLTLLLPMVVVACHCCSSMPPMVPSSEVSLNAVHFMACCFMLTVVKECAPKIEKFLQVSQSFLKEILVFSQNEIASIFPLSSMTRKNISPEAEDFISAQPPRYLALSILRV